MKAQVVVEEARHEEVAVIVAFLHAQLELMPASAANLFEKLRLELLGKEAALDTTDAVSVSFFFFFRLRGGRFFFSGCAFTASVKSALLEATSESLSPSSSA